jgi:hypothetical protein
VGPVDFSATPVDASLEFGDGQRPGLRKWLLAQVNDS